MQVQSITFSIAFCLFFIVTFLVLQASRLEQAFKSGKVIHIYIAYFLLSFISAFILAYGLNYIFTIILNKN